MPGLTGDHLKHARCAELAYAGLGPRKSSPSKAPKKTRQKPSNPSTPTKITIASALRTFCATKIWRPATVSPMSAALSPVWQTTLPTQRRFRAVDSSLSFTFCLVFVCVSASPLCVCAAQVCFGARAHASKGASRWCCHRGCGAGACFAHARDLPLQACSRLSART